MMISDQIVASLGVRVATGLLATCSAGAFVLYQQPGDATDSSRWLLMLGIGTGIAALMGLILSIRPIYTVWMQFAEALQSVVTVLIFSLFYLLAVPLLIVFVRKSDPLKMSQRAAKEETFWIPRRKDDNSPRSFQRMG